ncbi:MAG: hypothetical protein AAF559_10805 [Pseudomonadota bacterium]
MIDIKLDIAGFYFRYETKIEEGSTVKQLMQKVKEETHTVGFQGAKLDFESECITINEMPKEFLDAITIEHTDTSARSGQKYGPGNNDVRLYPGGIYSAADEAGDFAIPSDNTQPFVATDRNKTGLLAWQYYVYDAKGVDVSRAPTTSATRRVIPYSKTITRDAEAIVGLQHDDTVVWRLIMVRTRPNGLLPPKMIHVCDDTADALPMN